MINYYEVQNCVFENYQNNQPVLIAPQGYDPAVLARNGFVALPDGRWAHFMTEQEYRYLCSVPQGQNAQFYAGMFNQPAQNVQGAANPFQGTPAPNTFQPQGAPVTDTRTPEQIKKDTTISNVLAGCSALCLLLSFVLGGAEAKDLYGLIAVLFQIGLVLMIIVRVRYKDNVFGKILLWIYIIFGVLVILGVILFIAACGAILKDCNID